MNPRISNKRYLVEITHRMQHACLRTFQFLDSRLSPIKMAKMPTIYELNPKDAPTRWPLLLQHLGHPGSRDQ
eukprot:3934379-Lingulodinium_polyedra.AAC.1